MSLLLVTGAPGWLGSRLLDACSGARAPEGWRAGWPVTLRCLALDAAAEAALQARWPAAEVVRGDVRDPRSLARFVGGAQGAWLIHAAGLIHPRGGTRALFEVNAAGTRSLVEAARQGGVRRFVYLSSSAAVGVAGSPAQVFDERTPERPYLAYGRSKRQGEQAVLAGGGALEPVVVRAPWFYGPGQPERQSRFIRMVRRGRAPRVGRGDNLRSMAYVDDLVQGLLLAATVPAAAGGTYWIADERPYSQAEILQTIRRVLEDDFHLPVAGGPVPVPRVAARLAALADRSLQALGRYQTELHVLGELDRTIACSVHKARAELGYSPRVSLAEGMRRSIAWMIDHGDPP